ncbi:MAG TPA: Stf0 family sulfotransferase [Dongiaceae bacterium]|jgi:LPS sulfotransferase NodH|nr:Stf0 family sulfotransferase [Dongiaceae bacterium]
MSATEDAGRPAHRVRPLRSVRRAAKRWRRTIGIRLGLLPAPAERGYMICATARSGSNYLCQLLASTQVLGNPLEYFNTAGRRRQTDPNYPSDRRAQIDLVRSIGATPNGIYAVKILPPQLTSVENRIDLFRHLPNLTLFRLGRRDLLGQAISLARARQTGQYIASHPRTGAPTYSQAQIRACIAALREQESMLDGRIGRLGLKPYRFHYEDILRDPQQVVDRIASLMGIALPVAIDRALVTHTIQRDDSTIVWRERFLAETGEEFRHLIS